MIKSFFRSILARRRFWRYATFDEVAELYMARMLRMAALYIVGGFIAIYLYQIGYSISTICFLWVGFYWFKALITLPLARIIGWIGPKHSIFLSNILYIPAMIGYALLPDYGIGLLLIVLALQGASNSLYAIAHSVNFSKVKSSIGAGKQIANMNIFEKITTGVSPLIGGLLAYLWGPQVVIWIAAVLFALAAVPLMRTGEKVRTRQRLVFVGFPWRLLFRHTPAHGANGFDVFAAGVAWSLYLAVFIIGVSKTDNDVYAITGALSSVVLVAAILASYTYGKLIDGKKGGELMRIGAMFTSLVHLIRPFIQSPVSAAGVNAAHELSITAYNLPYTRGLFDNADISGARIMYIAVADLIANIGAGVGALALGFLALGMGDQLGMKSFFFLAAAVSLLMLTARFPLYKK